MGFPGLAALLSLLVGGGLMGGGGRSDTATGSSTTDTVQDLTAIEASGEDETDDPVVDDPVVDDPVVDDPVADDPVVDDPVVDSGADDDDQQGIVTPFDTDMTVITGRVTTFSLEGDIKSVKVLEGPEYGNLTVNPDQTLALVLTGETQTTPITFQLEVEHADGQIEILEAVDDPIEVIAGEQGGGWGLGEHYMLETDEDGDLVVEHGSNHRKVYVSESEDALSLADIALIEGVPVEDVNGKFFKADASYGAGPDSAVDQEVGKIIWDSLTAYGDGPSSDWLLFERGYEYDDFPALLPNGAEGESALHPLYVGAWGTGEDPVMGREFSLTKDGGTHVVIDGLDFTGGIRALAGENILLNDLKVTENGLDIQNIDGFTLRNSEVSNVTDEKPNTEDYWGSHSDRESGIFAKNIDGLLIENTLFDHNGWAEDYRYDMSSEGGQPPSIYSHNVYIQGDVDDVTFRDNIVMRAAADGAQLRTGGFVEDNVFIDNNNALLISRGRALDTDVNQGEYSLVNGNVITSGAHKETVDYRGGLTQGITAQGMDSTYIDNIVTHMVDPDDPDAKAETRVSQYSIWHRYDDPTYDDTIVFNWVGDETNQSSKGYEDRFVEGLDTDLLDETTIQNLAGHLLGKESASIDELGDYLSQVFDEGGPRAEQMADEIALYFRESFEVDTAMREDDDAQTLRFVPNELSAGVRWDNRLNWTSETLPGAAEGDSVDLADNWVVYSGTTEIKDLDFGNGGEMWVHSGRLDVTGETITGQDGASVDIDDAGQLWINGYSGDGQLDVTANGGRFANTDIFKGMTDLNAGDDAQVLLATNGAGFALSNGSTMTVSGSDVDIGFDGTASDEAAALLIQEGAALNFVADEEGFSQIGEFYSGAYGTTGLDSAIMIEGGTLDLDVTALSQEAGHSGTLLSADQITGQFEDLTVNGLSNQQDLTVMVDYDLDDILYLLSAEGTGTGQVYLDSRGFEEDDEVENLPDFDF